MTSSSTNNTHTTLINMQNVQKINTIIKFDNLYFNYKVLQSTACSDFTASQVITLQLDRNSIVMAEMFQVHLEID